MAHAKQTDVAGLAAILLPRHSVTLNKSGVTQAPGGNHSTYLTTCLQKDWVTVKVGDKL